MRNLLVAMKFRTKMSTHQELFLPSTEITKITELTNITELTEFTEFTEFMEFFVAATLLFIY